MQGTGKLVHTLGTHGSSLTVLIALLRRSPSLRTLATSRPMQAQSSRSALYKIPRFNMSIPLAKLNSEFHISKRSIQALVIL
jgi:hypothetical protein